MDVYLSVNLCARGALHYSLLRGATVVKILTKNFIIALHIFMIVGFIAEILLDLDQFDRVYQEM